MAIAVEVRNPVTQELVATAVQTSAITIATTSTSDALVMCSESGLIDSIDFVGIDALAAHASNYITFSVTNLGQAGTGTTALLAATDANTTKTTTGTAVVAAGRRSLTLTATASDLRVARGDVLRFRSTAAATSANTITGARVSVRINTTQ